MVSKVILHTGNMLDMVTLLVSDQTAQKEAYLSEVQKIAIPDGTANAKKKETLCHSKRTHRE